MPTIPLPRACVTSSMAASSTLSLKDMAKSLSKDLIAAYVQDLKKTGLHGILFPGFEFAFFRFRGFVRFRRHFNIRGIFPAQFKGPL